MKNLSFLLCMLIICLFACQNKEQQTETPPEESSPEWLTFEGKAGAGKGKKVVLISGDEEYRSEEAMPMLAKILAKHHGFDCTVLFAQDPAKPGIINPNVLNNISGMEALNDADMMILFTRFRELPDDQMEIFQNYLMSGKPLIGIRTATHAFNIKDTTSKWLHYSNFYNGELKEWEGGFGRLVMGEKWISHHGHHKHQSTRGIIAPNGEGHPILNGIADGEIWGPTDVYGVRLPLPDDSKPLVLGQVVNRAGEFDKEAALYGMSPTDTEVAVTNTARDDGKNPNDPMMPIAWTKTYQLPGGTAGTCFSSTIGASTDMLSEAVRRMYVNAVYWSLGLEVPEKANVDFVVPFEPKRYHNHGSEYWEKRGLKVSDLAAFE